MKQEINVIDLFCGAGGLSYGFKKAGFNVLIGIDHDEIAIRTFKKNHPDSKVICGDITNISKEEIINIIGKQKIDVVIGGPPCQGFSMAGSRNPSDPRNSLIKHYLKFVSQFKPKIFVIENVLGLLSMKTEKGEKVIDLIKKMALKYGYYVHENLLNAGDYGVPQKRKRIVLVGSKEKSLKLEIRKKSKVTVGAILLKKQDVPHSYFYSRKLIRGFRRRDKINKKLGRGFGWKFLKFDEPSYTISARYYKDGAEALVKYSENEIRMLTPEECAAIQTFPKNYIFDGGKIQTYKQIGNAVPPKLAFEIAKSIKKLI